MEEEGGCMISIFAIDVTRVRIPKHTRARKLHSQFFRICIKLGQLNTYAEELHVIGY